MALRNRKYSPLKFKNPSSDFFFASSYYLDSFLVLVSLALALGQSNPSGTSFMASPLPNPSPIRPECYYIKGCKSLSDNGRVISVDWCSNASHKLYHFLCARRRCNPDPGKVAIGIVMPPGMEMVACHCCGKAYFFRLYNKSEQFMH